jgi:hypothetical protein
MDTESAQILNDMAQRYGAANAHDAHLEWLYAVEFGELPDGARFLESIEAVIDDAGDEAFIVVLRAPEEVRKLQ